LSVLQGDLVKSYDIIKIQKPLDIGAFVSKCDALSSAEREGFEPTVGSSPTAVFKTAAINRSAISPGANIGE
jgi:hypothetical protein